MAGGNIATSYMDVLIINFLKNRIMEIIFIYLAASYLVMFGFASFLYHSKRLTIEDKSDLAVVVVLLLFAPLSLLILAVATSFGTLCKLLGE